MPLRQKAFAICVSIMLLVLIVELVRRKRLREEHSVLWIAGGSLVFLLSLWYDLLLDLTAFIGAVSSSSTLFILGFVFLVLTNLHYAVKISSVTDQLTMLMQEIALLKSDVEEKT